MIRPPEGHEYLPPLHGDGKGDDTAAVQTWFDAGVPLPPGDFKITAPVTTSPPRRVEP